MAEGAQAFTYTPGRVGRQVVAEDLPALLLHTRQHLFELQPYQPAVGAELDAVAVDLLGDAAHHLGALQHRNHVAYRDHVLDFERGEGVRHHVEAVPIALQRLEGLVGPGQEPFHGHEGRFAALPCTRI